MSPNTESVATGSMAEMSDPNTTVHTTCLKDRLSFQTIEENLDYGIVADLILFDGTDRHEHQCEETKNKGGDNRAQHSKRHNRSKILKERAFFQIKPGREDDGWQEAIEKGRRREFWRIETCIPIKCVTSHI